MKKLFYIENLSFTVKDQDRSEFIIDTENRIVIDLSALKYNYDYELHHNDTKCGVCDEKVLNRNFNRHEKTFKR